MSSPDRRSITRYSIEFPLSGPDEIQAPQLEIRQAQGAHDVATILTPGRLNNLDKGYTTGAPVRIKWSNRWGSNQFVGYVHHVQNHFGSDNSSAKIVCVGASFPLIAVKQRAFSNATADLVVKTVAAEYGLLAVTESHPRVYGSIPQPTISDWALLCRLADETGYVLRADQTRIYFLPRATFEAQNKPMAQVLTMTTADANSLTAATTVFDFEPLLAEYFPERGVSNTRKAIKAIDPETGRSIELDGGLANNQTGGLFTKSVNEVTNSVQDARARLEASLEANRFIHRARVTSVGSPVTAPEKMVYIVGVPAPYDGYWTVLSVTHRIKNATQYVMEMEVGTDMLVGNEPTPSSTLTNEMSNTIAARDVSSYQTLRLMDSDSRLDVIPQDVTGVLGKPFGSAWKSTTLTEV